MSEVACPGCGGAVSAIAQVVLQFGFDCVTSGRCTWQQFLQLLLDPYDLWFGQFFVGRPKVGPHSATDAAALFLIPSVNPVVALWGGSIRGYEAIGCFLSGGGPCLLALENLAAAAQADLAHQFGAEGYTLFSQYAYLLRQHNPDTSKVLIAARTVLDRDYTLAVQQGRIDPKTGFPPASPLRCGIGMHVVPVSGKDECRICAFDPTVNPCPPKPPPLCPPGEVLDPATELCVKKLPTPTCPTCVSVAGRDCICPAGYTFDDADAVCRGPECPAHHVIIPPPPKCPVGTYWNGRECVVLPVHQVTSGHCDCSTSSPNYIGAWK